MLLHPWRFYSRLFDENLDYIAVGKPGDPDTINYTYTNRGNPVDVQMPAEAGEYEIRYVLYQDRKVLATQAIMVETISVSLDAPDSAQLGESLIVEWQGPDARSDYIVIADP